MNSGKVTMAAELEQMTMAERQAHLEASIEFDLTDLPEAFLGRPRSPAPVPDQRQPRRRVNHRPVWVTDKFHNEHEPRP